MGMSRFRLWNLLRPSVSFLGASWSTLGASWEHLGEGTRGRLFLPPYLPNVLHIDICSFFSSKSASQTFHGQPDMENLIDPWHRKLGYPIGPWRPNRGTTSALVVLGWWDFLGDVLVSLWNLLRPSWNILGASWSTLGASWEHLGQGT